MNRFVLKIVMIGIKIALGLLFLYAGAKKFYPDPPRQTVGQEAEIPANLVKMKELVGGMKNSGYFWEMVGVAELLCGALLISQVFSLLGAVMLIPVTSNIFLFHAALEPHHKTDLLLTAMYLLANLAILAYHYPQLKYAFLTNKIN